MMKTEEFQILAAELERLTPHQRRLLADCLHKVGHVQAVSALNKLVPRPPPAPIPVARPRGIASSKVRNTV
jgi:hypothetical protein